jgi:hypothetical protein
MMSLTIKFLVLLTLTATSVEAKISEDLRDVLPKYLRDAKLNQTSMDGVINIVGAEIKTDLYAKPIFLEVEIANIDHTREIYIVNQSNDNQRNNRNTKAEFISNPTSNLSRWMSNGGDSTGNAQVVYVGRGENDTSRFVILSPGTSANTYITLYVKMGGKQYSTQVYVNGGF